MLAAQFFPHMVSDAMTSVPSNGYREPADNECIFWDAADFNGASYS